MEPTSTASPVQPMPMSSNKSSSGVEENLAALLCYLLSPLAGIVFLIIEKDSKFIKFHAFQSIAVFLCWLVGYLVFIVAASIIPFLGCLGCLVAIGYLAIIVILMIKAYQHEMYKLPVIGDYIEKNLVK